MRSLISCDYGLRSADGRAGTQHHAQLRVRLTFRFFSFHIQLSCRVGIREEDSKALKERHFTQYN